MEKQLRPATIFGRIGINYYENPQACDQLLKGLSNNSAVYPDISNKYNLKDYKYNDNSTRNDSKLTEDDVSNIYMLITMNGSGQAELSRQYNITPAAVYNIMHKKNWKELTDQIDEDYFEQPIQDQIEVQKYTTSSDEDYLKVSEDNTINALNEINQALGC